MKKIHLKSFLFAVCLTLSGSCGDFGDINIDPNNTTSIKPENLLTTSLRGVRFVFTADLGFLYVQHFSENTYTETSRYAQVNFDFNAWYSAISINLQKIIELNSDESTRESAQISGSNANQIAVARILKAYFFHFLTDRWGPLPYSQALKGRENFKPAYDSQEVIYQDLLKELKEAVEQIDTGPGVVGDFLFKGDMKKWKQFANTLRLNAAMRISKIAPELGKKAFLEALQSGVISSVSENIMYPFLAETNNENPVFANFKFGTFISLSEPFVNRLLALKDPRLYSFADPSLNGGKYAGMPYGVANPTLDPEDVCFPNSKYARAQDSPMPIITYAQVLFNKAEAAQKGWINENSEQLYYQAIQASMEQWHTYKPETFKEYITQREVKWDKNKAFQLIGEQKWIALFTQGNEAWAEWRRLDFPKLKPAPDALNTSKQIPVRQGYPPTERDINSENWKTAVDKWLKGEDGLDSKLWWDVE